MRIALFMNATDGRQDYILYSRATWDRKGNKTLKHYTT